MPSHVEVSSFIASSFGLVSTTVSMPLPQMARNQYLSSSELVKMYFEEGYTYKLILCFLSGLHGIIISLSTPKRMLKKQNLRRRRPLSRRRLIRAGECLLVSYFGSKLYNK